MIKSNFGISYFIFKEFQFNGNEGEEKASKP
jgi:hypothetical protein